MASNKDLYKESIYCVECHSDVDADLVYGSNIYPHRPDLSELPFWRCPVCNNYVGCHHKTNNPTKPLGVIPNKELKELRKRIHSMLDPLWKGGRWSRKEIYAKISDKFGRPYHTGELRSLEEAKNVINIIKEIVESDGEQ